VINILDEKRGNDSCRSNAIVARNTTFVALAKAACSAIPRAARIFGVIPGTAAKIRRQSFLVSSHDIGFSFV
jgi:hypothetical protein